MADAEQTWVVRVRVPERKVFWFGTFTASGRTDAKRAARLFVSEHLPLDTLILGIAPGVMEIKFHGEEIPMDDAEQEIPAEKH